MNTKRARSLFIELRDYLKAHSANGLKAQIKYAGDAVLALDAVSSEKEKEDVVKAYYRNLFPGGRGGLSDVILWDKEYSTRVALNEPIERIRKELKELIDSVPAGAPVPGSTAPSEKRAQREEEGHIAPDSPVTADSGRESKSRSGSGKRFLSALLICPVLVLVLSIFFGYEGKHVLTWAFLFAAALIMLGALTLAMLHTGMLQMRYKGAAMAACAICILFGLVTGAGAAADLVNGSRVELLYDCRTDYRLSAHGVSSRYYLTGRNADGNTQRFPLAFGSQERIGHGDTLLVEYYETTGRLVSFGRIPETFGDLEKSTDFGKLEDPVEIKKVLLEMSHDGLSSTIAIDLEKQEAYLDKAPSRIYRESPDTILTDESTAAVRDVLEEYDVLDWKPGYGSSDGMEDGSPWILVVQGTRGVKRTGGSIRDTSAPASLEGFAESLRAAAAAD